jgi:hypothetical protein
MPAVDFRVRISGGTVSLDVWRQAMEAAECDLPQLNEAQKEAARRIGMDEAEYARGVLAEEIGGRKQQEKGQRLGGFLIEILSRVGQGWKLESLVRKGVDSLWIARLENAGAFWDVEIPLELVDDVVDSGGAFGRGRLENLVVSQIDQSVVRKAS